MTNTLLVKKVTFLCLVVFLLWGHVASAQVQDTVQVQSARPQAQDSVHTRLRHSIGTTISFIDLGYDDGSFPFPNPVFSYELQYVIDERIGLGFHVSTDTRRYLHYFALQADVFLGSPKKGPRVALGLGAGLFYVPGEDNSFFALRPRLYLQGHRRFSLGIGYNFFLADELEREYYSDEIGSLVVQLLWQVGKEKHSKRPRTPK